MATHRAPEYRGTARVQTGPGRAGLPQQPAAGDRGTGAFDPISENYTRDVDRFYGWLTAFMVVAVLAPVIIAALVTGLLL
jgi:hypothetical protein